MAWNASGTFSRISTSVSPATTGTTIDSADMNTYTADVTTGINSCLAKNGENAATGDLDLGGNLITNLGDGVADDDAATVGQLASKITSVMTTAAVTWTQDTTYKTTGITLTNLPVGHYAYNGMLSFVSSNQVGDDGMKAKWVLTNASHLIGTMVLSVNTLPLAINSLEISGVEEWSFTSVDLYGTPAPTGYDQGGSITGTFDVTNATNSIDLHMAQESAVGSITLELDANCWLVVTQIA